MGAALGGFKMMRCLAKEIFFQISNPHRLVLLHHFRECQSPFEVLLLEPILLGAVQIRPESVLLWVCIIPLELLLVPFGFFVKLGNITSIAITGLRSKDVRSWCTPRHQHVLGHRAQSIRNIRDKGSIERVRYLLENVSGNHSYSFSNQVRVRFPHMEPLNGNSPRY